jgi:hypothetical protein
MQGKEGFVPLFAATDRKKEANGTNGSSIPEK